MEDQRQMTETVSAKGAVPLLQIGQVPVPATVLPSRRAAICAVSPPDYFKYGSGVGDYSKAQSRPTNPPHATADNDTRQWLAGTTEALLVRGYSPDKSKTISALGMPYHP
jgi:hypothetical protein